MRHGSPSEAFYCGWLKLLLFMFDVRGWRVVHAPHSIVGANPSMMDVTGGCQGRRVLSVSISVVSHAMRLSKVDKLRRPNSFCNPKPIEGWGLDWNGPQYFALAQLVGSRENSPFQLPHKFLLNRISRNFFIREISWWCAFERPCCFVMRPNLTVSLSCRFEQCAWGICVHPFSPCSMCSLATKGTLKVANIYLTPSLFFWLWVPLSSVSSPSIESHFLTLLPLFSLFHISYSFSIQS